MRAVAVFVGLANVLFVDPRDVLGSSGGRSLAALFGAFLLAVVAGLLASEVVLRLGRSALSGGFSARYGIAVLGMCLGGAILGGLSLAVGLLTSQPPGVQGPGWGVAILIYAAVAYGSIAAVVGGVLGALEGLILAFPLAIILGTLLRSGNEGRGSSLPGVALLLCLLTVAAIVSYAASPPPQAASADLANNPPLSCPEYLGEEIATYKGPGDRTTPAFETTGDGWGYEHSAAGPGSLRVTVLDGNGNVVKSPEEDFPEEDFGSGNSVGGAEFASSGTFSLEMEADEDVEYEVLVCD